MRTSSMLIHNTLFSTRILTKGQLLILLSTWTKSLHSIWWSSTFAKTRMTRYMRIYSLTTLLT